MRIRRVRKCRVTGKRGYASNLDAAMALGKVRSSIDVERRQEIRSYLCQFCHAWHLTSKPERLL